MTAVANRPSVVDQPAADNRWERRPRLAFVVRAVVFLAPAIVATDVSLILTRALPRPDGILASVVWWVAVLGAAAIVLVAFDRLFRRMLPFSVLLDLALVFPGVAPSRFSAAFRAGSVRNLQRRLEVAKERAPEAGTAEAAATVVELIAALAVHDPKTRGHSERTRAYADLIAEELGLNAEDRDRLRWSALLHDIGKLHVTPTLLNKVGRPDVDEWEVLRSHPAEGARIIGALRPWLGPWGLAVEQHHERFDGAGYPGGLAGEQISLGGRIVSVADAFEVMTSVRSYTPPVSPAAAREELVRCAGSHFDPAIVRAFLRIAIARHPRRAGFLVLLAQLPGFAVFQQVLQQAGSAVVAGVAVTGLAVGGVVGPAVPGLGGVFEDRPSTDAAEQASPSVDGPTAPSAKTPGATVPSGGSATEPTTAETPTPNLTEPAPAEPAPVEAAPAAESAAPAPAPAPPPARSTGGSYLSPSVGTGAATLSPAFPTGSGAPDYDGDGLPGRTLTPSARPATSTEQAERQVWVQSVRGGAVIAGSPKLVISSAVAGFGSGRGKLRGFLLDCDANGGNCAAEPIATAFLSEADWGTGSGGLVSKTLQFSNADHVFATGRTLVLRLAAQRGSEPLVVAYGTTSHPAFLSVDMR